MSVTSGGVVAVGGLVVHTNQWSPLVFTAQEFGGLAVGFPSSDLTIEVAGLYLVTVGYSWPANATGMRLVRPLKNGVACGTFAAAHGADAGDGSTGPSGTLSCVVTCAVGDVISADCYQSSGGDLTIGSPSRYASCALHVVKVG